MAKNFLFSLINDTKNAEIIKNGTILYHNSRVFWVNIVKSEVNLRYKNCLNLFGILKRKIEFRYYCYQNSTKSMREKKKKVGRKNVEFRQRDIEFPVPNSTARVRGVPEVKRKKN